MWSERKLPIHIYIISQQISKERFIEWLVHRGFVQQPSLSTGQIFCILHPCELEQVYEVTDEKKAKFHYSSRSADASGTETQLVLMQNVMLPSELQITNLPTA